MMIQVFVSSGGVDGILAAPDLVSIDVGSNQLSVTSTETQISRSYILYWQHHRTNAGNSYLGVIDLFTLTSGQSARVKVKVIGVQTGVECSIY